MLLKIEPFSGISGDMMLGALVELTDGGERLKTLPGRLQLVGARIAVEPVLKTGIACTRVSVIDETDPRVRHLADIEALIDAADLDPTARDLARRIFRILGEAEAAAHGVGIDQVHFHEVGAVDSILDIVGTAVLLTELRFDRVVSGPVTVGSGFVDCAHGRMPVPAPATERILRGMPNQPGPVAREMTTPTGAAILRALDPSFELTTHAVVRTGHGAGTRDLDQPNCLRVSLAQPAAAGDRSWLLQTNLDDAPGELLGEHLQRRLLAAGALDVTLTPLLMKKGRPGHRLDVLCTEADRVAVTDLILTETTTIGVRAFPVERRVLPRTEQAVTTPFGEVRLKVVTLPDGQKRRTPEYDDCVRCAEATGASLQDVMRAAILAAERSR